MAHDEDNRKPDEPVQPDATPKPAPEKSSGSETENDKFPDPPPRTFGTSRKPKKQSKIFGLWGILVFFLLIVAAGVGGGGYYLYQKQMRFQNEVQAKFSQLDDQLSTLDTEADLTRQNQQAIEAVNQDLQQFKTQVAATLKSHQNALTTLDEDVLRLKEKVNKPPEAPPAPPAPPVTAQEEDTAAEPLPQEISPDAGEEGDAEGTPEDQSERSEESQEFIDWVENFFAAIWNWLTGLFS